MSVSVSASGPAAPPDIQKKHMIALLPTIKDSTSVQVMVSIDSSTRKLLNQAPG